MQQNTVLALEILKNVQKRRTFAIISHPDAGKTTLTEKLLLYGGAIQLAGAVKAKGSQRHATSDWLDLEQKRGISISTTALQFDYQDHYINLLDTPGHKDFSEDTYRTLTAVDAAVMLLDAAKGVEPQTRKLFEVCQMRGVPIFTFVNKMDRPCKSAIELLDEVEKDLGIRCHPMNWPIGSGDEFCGIYDIKSQEVLAFTAEETSNARKKLAPVSKIDINSADLESFLTTMSEGLFDSESVIRQFREELELVKNAGHNFDFQEVSNGKLSPVFFGSAMNNFGVECFLERLIHLAPAPRPMLSETEIIEPVDTRFSGFVFKIQANMDPHHRDRVVFIRICSGRFSRNMEVLNQRSKKRLQISRPVQLFAQTRVTVDEAWPGDVIGIVDTSSEYCLGDTLTDRDSDIRYEGMPRFSPEHFCTVSLRNPAKRKQYSKGLEQLCEEGVVQLLKKPGGTSLDVVLGAVGVLQFEVFEWRLATEYNVKISINNLPFSFSKWVDGDEAQMRSLRGESEYLVVETQEERQLCLFRTEWSFKWAKEQYPKLHFQNI